MPVQLQVKIRCLIEEVKMLMAKANSGNLTIGEQEHFNRISHSLLSYNQFWRFFSKKEVVQLRNLQRVLLKNKRLLKK